MFKQVSINTPGPFLPYGLPATLPQACSVTWGSCGQNALPGTCSCYSFSHWLQCSDLACSDPPVGPSYTHANESFLPEWWEGALNTLVYIIKKDIKED